MATNIVMPKQGNTVEECVLVSWTIKPGDSVETGQVIGEIETDKATFDLEASVGGEVLALLCNEGDIVPVLENIAVIGDPGETLTDLPQGGSRDDKTPVPTTSGSNESPAPTPPIEVASPAVVSAEPSTSFVGNVGVSPRARNLAQTKGISVEGLKGTGPKGRIIERDVSAALENGPTLTSLAKEVAKDSGLVAPATGSGLGGRVLSTDLQSPTATRVEAPQTEVESNMPEFEEETLKGVRKLIAERMHESLQKTAQLTLNTSAHVESMLNYRKRVKAYGEKAGLGSITIGDMVFFVVSRILSNYPKLNATLQDQMYRKYKGIHLGFACDTPKGLMVPVIPNAEKYSLNDIAKLVKERAEQAKSGSINPDYLQGGSFTISNLGVLGITSFTPVLNYPQVGILGVGALDIKPVKVNDAIVYQEHIGLSLTIDHRIIDGWEASLFLKDLRNAIEQFELFLAR